MYTQQAGKLEITFQYLRCKVKQLRKKIMNKMTVNNRRDRLRKLSDAPSDNIIEDANRAFAKILTTTIIEMMN